MYCGAVYSEWRSLAQLWCYLIDMRFVEFNDVVVSFVGWTPESASALWKLILLFGAWHSSLEHGHTRRMARMMMKPGNGSKCEYLVAFKARAFLNNTLWIRTEWGFQYYRAVTSSLGPEYLIIVLLAWKGRKKQTFADAQPVFSSSIVPFVSVHKPRKLHCNQRDARGAGVSWCFVALYGPVTQRVVYYRRAP